jgi:hypothetical protein
MPIVSAEIVRKFEMLVNILIVFVNREMRMAVISAGAGE